MRKFAFLFVLIVLFSIVIDESGNNKIKKNKTLEIAKKDSRKSNQEDLSWKIAEASYYDPMDPKQTKENPDGIGAFGRRIDHGSVSLGSSMVDSIRKEKLLVFIKVEDLDIITPYGKGIFRVDDSMSKDYQKNGKYYIDFREQDLEWNYKKLGRFNVKFKFHKIQKESDYF